MKRGSVERGAALGTARAFRAGFTLIELMVVVAVIAILAGLAIPGLLSAKKAANEGASIAFLKMALTVNEQYRTRYNRYPGSALDLENTDLIDSQDAAGYDVSYVPSVSTWFMQLNPREPGISGDRYFYVDQTGVIRVNLTQPATATDPPLH